MAQILVIDDEPAVRGALVAHLSEMGHTCTEAGDGLEGLDRLHECEFDLIVTDVAMPRLNGLQFLERALPYLEDRVPVVLLSSVNDRGAIAAAVGAGAFDYLTKPAHPDEVRRVVEESLVRRSEALRLHGRRRGPGGPVPKEALGERPEDRLEAAIEQAPAGVPAFRTRDPFVSVPRPDDSDAPMVDVPEERGSFLRLVRRWFGSRVA